MLTTSVHHRQASTSPEILWPIPILHWPEDAAENEALVRARRPRLLLVAADTEAPIDLDGLSDWIRRPATAGDIYARVAGLQRRVEQPLEVRIDEDGLLRRGRRWVALSPVDLRLVQALLVRPGAVVSRGELMTMAWPHGRVAARALTPRLSRLRGRIAPLGLQIVNVRQRGYALTVDDGVRPA
jgi:DNA-binding response OmpR family regulator